MEHDLVCPDCDSGSVKVIAVNSYKCLDCGLYYDDDDLSIHWERSSRNRTRAERDYDDHEHER